MGGGFGALLSGVAIYFFGTEDGRFSPTPALREALRAAFGDRFQIGTPPNDAVWVDPVIEGAAGHTGWDMAGRRLRSEIIQKAL